MHHHFRTPFLLSWYHHPSFCYFILFMFLTCEACGSSHKYNSDRGLHQHQLNCQEFLQADNEASIVDDALGKYRRKLQRKKHKAAVNEMGSLTGSGVRDSLSLHSILILLYRMRGRPSHPRRPQTRIWHWKQNMWFPQTYTAPLKTHLTSNPWLRLNQRSIPPVVVFERSG